jgi:lipid-A-disaccharide synthase
MTPRLLLVAGESSGDLHGSHLARALLARHPDARLSGVGGPRMREAGVDVLFDVRSLAVVGAVEALHSIRALWTVYRLLLARLAREPVDAVVLIDFPGFNLKLAQAVRRRGIPALYYIAPQIWAWRPGRIEKIRRRIHKLFVVLPFEEALYRQAGIEAEFVGHPLLDLVQPTRTKAEICASHGLDPEVPIVGLLPGSRRSELRYLLPPMLGAAGYIRAALERVQFVLPLANTLEPADVQSALDASTLPVRLVWQHTYEMMQVADVLLVASGTATLEAALFQTPMVIVYRAHPLTYLLAQPLLRIPWIGLPNIIAGRPIVPELHQSAVTPDNMAAQALALLTQPEQAAAMRGELSKLRSQLGSPGVAARVARGVWEEVQGAKFKVQGSKIHGVPRTLSCSS